MTRLERLIQVANAMYAEGLLPKGGDYVTTEARVSNVIQVIRLTKLEDALRPPDRYTGYIPTGEGTCAT